jgi:hypothetical protein
LISWISWHIMWSEKKSHFESVIAIGMGKYHGNRAINGISMDAHDLKMNIALRLHYKSLEHR